MTTIHQPTHFEYRSKAEISGWPLIHINVGTHPVTGRPLVAKGVVAIGNFAIGVVSIGAAAIGMVTLAAFGLGIVSLASLAIGIIALGVVAFGKEIALGTVVFSPNVANGVLALDVRSAVWLLICTAFIALVFWGLGKIKTVRPRS